MKFLIKLFIIFGFFFNDLAWSNQAPGAPGFTPAWTDARKTQVGTSNSGTNSLVWFTNSNGILTETYYPTIDEAQIKDSQLLISDGRTFLAEEKRLIHQVEVLHPSLVRLRNIDPKNKFQIEHTFYTFNNGSVLVDEVVVDSYVDGLSFYLLTNSALKNSGKYDSAFAADDALIFKQDDREINVSATVGFEKTSVGYVGSSDGYQDLADDFQMNRLYGSAVNGNVAGMGKLQVPARKGRYKFYVVYNFTGNEKFFFGTLDQEKMKYVSGWDHYLKSLNVPTGISKSQLNLYYRSLYTLKVHEDKLYPGAMIASLSIPWGEDVKWDGAGGYHLVWPRDLFHVSLAFINAGDYNSALRALRYLKSIQYKTEDYFFDPTDPSVRKIKRKGAFPQNVWVDGRLYWGGLQIDQVGYPIQLFYHLYIRANDEQKRALMNEFSEMLHFALRFIVDYGPWSAQERWEENFGISPSSFSVATAALYMGSRIFNTNYYENIANKWLYTPNDNIHTWTYTTKGAYDTGRGQGNGEYYIRVAGCSSHHAEWNPNNGHHCIVKNHANPFYIEQTKVVDQGFLKLGLMGLMRADDHRLLNSLNVVNKVVRKTFSNGKFSGWYRYSYDAYGENHRGRIWPLLSGEHGRFAIERYRVGNFSWSQAEGVANNILSSYEYFANAGDMIPEQIFENSGVETASGTGAATPLAWSHAEYVKLIWSKIQKRNVENVLK